MRLASALLALAQLAALACEPEEPAPEAPLFLADCTANGECAQGHVCVDGSCVIGACDPAAADACALDDSDPWCCRWWQFCDDTLVCETFPQARGIGCDATDATCTPCETDEHCASGQICSAFACANVDGAEDCASTVDCPIGERCDPEASLCVPDRGGCALCDEIPELCCDANRVCSTASGRCVVDAATACNLDDDCADGLHCSVARCVQCDADTPCGPGLACDEGVGTCASRTTRATARWRLRASRPTTVRRS